MKFSWACAEGAGCVREELGIRLHSTSVFLGPAGGWALSPSAEELTTDTYYQGEL